MPDIDARPLALRALRTLLTGTPASSIEVAGVPVEISVQRLPSPPWPPIERLDPSVDGPWPEPLEVHCRWEGGEVRLLVNAQYWKTKGGYRHQVTLQVRVVEPNHELMWTNVEAILKQAKGGEAVITGDVALRSRNDDDEARVRILNQRLSRLVTASGLPRASSWRIDLFRVRGENLELSPSPDEALTRILRLALLKLPFYARGGRIPAEQLPFEIEEAVESGDPGDEESPKKAAIYPLPGGVREYKRTLDEIVEWAKEPQPSKALEEFFRKRYGVKGLTAIKVYVALPRTAGLIVQKNGLLSLSQAGEEYRATKDPRLAFRALNEAFSGLLESLVIVDQQGPVETAEHNDLLCRLLEADWTSKNQTSFRRNWLLSLGLTDRIDEGDVLTALGREVLDEHRDAAEAIKARLGTLLTDPSIDLSGEDESEAEEELEAEETSAQRVELSFSDVAPHLGTLKLASLVVEQACAALSCGKHLLLVGPPGTGKTELAVALGEAAKKLEYCEGVRPTTANADWTTFETIGGYALEPGQSGGVLVFRPGVFLNALEANQWLLVDELNRADVDRAFGELMTVLAGRGATLAYRMPNGRTVSVGPPGDEQEPADGWSHPVPPTFRLIATMNTWDKSSLFKLSYALQRRFAILHVDVPDDDTYAGLVIEKAQRPGFDTPLPSDVAQRLARLFDSKDGLLQFRRIGAAVALDVVSYVRRRFDIGAGDAVAEAIALFVLPQLEGLERAQAKKARSWIERSLGEWASAGAVRMLLERWSDLLLDDDDPAS